MKEHPGIKFIREDQAGKFGCIARGELRAFMYARMLDMDDEDKVFYCRHTFERQMVNVSREALPGLKNCWISQKGEIYYCTFAGHRPVAEHVFLQKEEDFEKTHAKITQNPLGCPMDNYVVRPSRAMKRAISDVLKMSRIDEEDDLLDELRFVPKDKKIKMTNRNFTRGHFPIGEICHEAADRIEMEKRK